MTALKRRLDALEKSNGPDLTVVKICGGVPDSATLHGVALNADEYQASERLAIVARDGESDDEFRNRAETEARAAGKKFLVLEGLPNA